jgi:hypothetical protein
MPAAGALARLLTAEAVRQRADELYEIGLKDGLPHFRLRPERIEAAAELVAQVTRERYPDLKVPLHSRWRHFEVDGRDLAAEAFAGLAGGSLLRARVRFAAISVLLDAGAGPDWRFDDAATGRRYARSEGLAVASLRGFGHGIDDLALAALDSASLARLYQVRPDNPLPGLNGRTRLLNALGRSGRVAGLHDDLVGLARGGRIAARDILLAVLEAFNDIWPSGLIVDGVPLGDVGRHSALRRADATDGLLPFHKLSQWLSYSLVEPLRAAGIVVTGLDGLTGLAEYRNGGLFLDAGVLEPRDPGLSRRRRAAGDEAVVEWRALTVALLDRIAEPVRRRLGLDAAALPLAAILQGGTWAAGRRLAEELRQGRPPLDIASDGTLF